MIVVSFLVTNRLLTITKPVDPDGKHVGPASKIACEGKCIDFFVLVVKRSISGHVVLTEGQGQQTHHCCALPKHWRFMIACTMIEAPAQD